MKAEDCKGEKFDIPFTLNEILYLPERESHDMTYCMAIPLEFEEELASETSISDLNCSEDSTTSRSGKIRGITRKTHAHGKTSVSPERKKSRGRRRCRLLETATSHSNQTDTSSNVGDVYEFRSSPELNISSKSSTDTITNSNVQNDKRNMNELEELRNELSKEANEHVEEKLEVEIDRKVPPLRISLPRTPSEDRASTARLIDDFHAHSSSSHGRRITRVTKFQIKKQFQLEEDAEKDDDGAQRVTRSRFRQKNRQSKDSVTSTEDVTRRKSGIWRKTVPLVPHSVPDLTSPVDQPADVDPEEQDKVFSGVYNEKEEDRAAAAADEVPLSLMKKNTYEGHRQLRSMIEQRWSDMLSQPAPNAPNYPKNYENYMIIKKNYTKTENLNVNQPNESTDDDPSSKLSDKLRDLWIKHKEVRQKMAASHTVERERIQMTAEKEVIRMRTRDANQGREFLSAIRVLQENEVYDAWYLNVKHETLPITEESEVIGNFEWIAETAQKRQQMEADSLYAVQSFEWINAIDRSGDPANNIYKDMVYRVDILPTNLSL